MTDERSDRPPDIEIGAAARARRLRFRRKPKTRTKVEAETRVRTDRGVERIEGETDSRSERRNLPDEVEPGVTYRDVEVGWVAEARAQMPERDDEGEDEETGER
jgi:hypothetical protein